VAVPVPEVREGEHIRARAMSMNTHRTTGGIPVQLGQEDDVKGGDINT